MDKRLKFEWHSAVSAAPLPDITKLIAFALWDFTNQDGGNAHPGNEQLARITGRSVVTIKRHLASLRKSGWLQRVEESNARGNRRFADVYQLAIPEQPGISQEIPDTDPDRVSPEPDRVSPEADRVSLRRDPIKYLTTGSKQQTPALRAGTSDAVPAGPRGRGRSPASSRPNGRARTTPASGSEFPQASSAELSGW